MWFISKFLIFFSDSVSHTTPNIIITVLTLFRHTQLYWVLKRHGTLLVFLSQYCICFIIVAYTRAPCWNLDFFEFDLSSSSISSWNTFMKCTSFSLYFLFKYDLGQKYYAPRSIRPRFELMTSRSWQYIACHWDACFNHLAISDLDTHFRDLEQA